MGEYADYILNGDDCQVCGEHIGNGDGVPRTCAGCGGGYENKKPPGRTDAQKAARNRQRRRRAERKRKETENKLIAPVDLC